jgi:oxaloacetate decarboxylase gamma subunit
MIMDINLVAEGLKFMVLGMGVVFIFLALLVQMMKWQAALIAKYFSPQTPPPSVYTPADDEKARVAAIIAAVTEYRNQNTKG